MTAATIPAVLYVLSSVLLAGVFAYLYALLRSRHLAHFALAWGLVTAGQIPIVLHELGLDPDQNLGVLAVAYIIALLVLRYATTSYVGKRDTWLWVLLAFPLAVAAPFVESQGLPPHLALAPLTTLMASLLIGAAVSLWRISPHTSDRLAAGALVLYALHLADYPLVGGLDWFLPIGIALATVLQLMFGIGLIVACLERELRRAEALVTDSQLPWFTARLHDGEILQANASFQKLTQLEPGTSLATLFSSADALEDFLTEIRSSGGIERDQTWSGIDPLNVHVSARTSPRGVGRDEAFDAFVLDRTEETKLAAEAEFSSRFEALGRLAGGIAHDFNNILTVIQSALELGQEDPEHLRYADKAIRRGVELTRTLVRFGRIKNIEADTPLPAHLVVLCRLLSRSLGERYPVAYEHRGPPCLVALSPGNLDRVLTNLVINSRDAMEDGGTITIVSRFSNEGHALICVTDSGPGLDPATIARVFEPLFTTKEQGTGLGLAIVRQLVEERGGEVRISSSKQGTELELKLPAQPLQPASTPQHTARIASTLTGIALVVDDDDDVRATTATVLRSAGMRVLEADGESTARLVSSEAYDILVTDVVLEDGNGLDLARHVLTQRPGLPVVFVSGYYEDVAPRRALFAHGAFLEKPFGSAELLRTVAGVLLGQSDPFTPRSQEEPTH